MNELVSIIVPVYNVEKYIDRCINSIIDQDYANWELILIDDGSTDNSGKRCDQYASERSNIYVIHQKNQGVSTARNVGIQIAKGEYFLFVDSDDWISPQMLSSMLGKNKDADLIVCDSYDVITDEDGNNTIKPHRTWGKSITNDMYYDVFLST